MTKLPSYCYVVNLEEESHSSLWESVFEVAYSVDIGVDDEENDRLICLLKHIDGRPLGAVWGPPLSDTYGFHIAVMPDQQGQGLGRYLIDAMLNDYAQVKREHPHIVSDFFVINESLRDALYRRGFYVKEEYFDNPNELSVSMTEAQTLAPFLQLAKDRSALKYGQAMQLGAAFSGVDVTVFEESFTQWCEAPTGTDVPPLLVRSGLHTILALPLLENDKQFLWATHQRIYKTPLSYENRHLLEHDKYPGSNQEPARVQKPTFR